MFGSSVRGKERVNAPEYNSLYPGLRYLGGYVSK